jgi:hypothetical protein
MRTRMRLTTGLITSVVALTVAQPGASRDGC